MSYLDKFQAKKRISQKLLMMLSQKILGCCKRAAKKQRGQSKYWQSDRLDVFDRGKRQRIAIEVLAKDGTKWMTTGTHSCTSIVDKEQEINGHNYTIREHDQLLQHKLRQSCKWLSIGMDRLPRLQRAPPIQQLDASLRETSTLLSFFQLNLVDLGPFVTYNTVK